MTKKLPLTVSWKNPELSFQVIQKWEKSDCSHPRAYLDLTARQVFCDVCRTQIDPFDFLVTLSEDEAQLLRRIKTLEERRRALEKEIQKLSKQKTPPGSKT